MKPIKAICIVSLFLFSFVNEVKPQNMPIKAPPSSALYVEAFGNNMVYSLNYENLLRQGNQIISMYRIGLGGTSNRFGVPIGIHFLKGRDGKYLDLGLGLTYIYGGQVRAGHAGTERGEGIFFTPTFGYRRQLSQKGFFFRVNAGLNVKMKEYTPALGKSGTQPILGLSFGYSFGKRKRLF